MTSRHHFLLFANYKIIWRYQKRAIQSVRSKSLVEIWFGRKFIRQPCSINYEVPYQVTYLSYWPRWLGVTDASFLPKKKIKQTAASVLGVPRGRALSVDPELVAKIYTVLSMSSGVQLAIAP